VIEVSIDTYFGQLKDIPAGYTEPTNVVHITEGTLRPPIHPHSLIEKFLQIYRRTWKFMGKEGARFWTGKI
jgi:hypothetical protein